MKKIRCEKRTNVILSVLFWIAALVLLVTFSIGLPIYVRPFYYIQIDMLDMPDDTGYTKEQIMEAYDEVLDFLVLRDREFGTGELSYSEEGKSHFEDCKVLFDLNITAFCISLFVVLLLCLLSGIGAVKLARPLGLPITFFSGLSALLLFGALGVIVALDFSHAFEVFHAIFFPGKENWQFDPFCDEIITVMPEEFFMNCAILIASSIIIISVILIIRGIRSKRKRGLLK